MRDLREDLENDDGNGNGNSDDIDDSNNGSNTKIEVCSTLVEVYWCD